LSVDTLRTLQLPLPNGRSVPLNQLATFDYTQEYPLVWRRDRVPMFTVQAHVASGVLPETVIAELRPAIAKLSAELPLGYRIELGGIAGESAKSRGLAEFERSLIMARTQAGTAIGGGATAVQGRRRSRTRRCARHKTLRWSPPDRPAQSRRRCAAGRPQRSGFCALPPISASASPKSACALPGSCRSDGILTEDGGRPRKQRHTSKRIFERRVNPKLSRRFPSAQTLDLYGVTNPTITLHHLHPPPSAIKPKGYLLP
jgi:hypothetical protein